jgi:hypothetical protein
VACGIANRVSAAILCGYVAKRKVRPSRRRCRPTSAPIRPAGLQYPTDEDSSGRSAGPKAADDNWPLTCTNALAEAIDLILSGPEVLLGCSSVGDGSSPEECRTIQRCYPRSSYVQVALSRLRGGRGRPGEHVLRRVALPPNPCPEEGGQHGSRCAVINGGRPMTSGWW